MSDTNAPVAEAETATPWTDPVCTEFAVADLTQAGGPGATDSGVLS
ncbi:hypothetical protein [Sphingomonas sp.]|jgi:hypothetical protein